MASGVVGDGVPLWVERAESNSVLKKIQRTKFKIQNPENHSFGSKFVLVFEI